MTQKKNELAPIREYLAVSDHYLALAGDAGAVMEAFEENLSGGGLSPFDLDRVKVPSQGSVTFEIPDIDEGTVSSKVLSGIIIHNAPSRSFWSESLESSTPTPPDCFSHDMRIGIGTPGGDCSLCPMNVFGSDLKGGRGKACGEQRYLFLLRPESFLPLVVQVPPSSLRNLNQYMLRLAGTGTKYSNVVTSLSLEKAIQAGGGLPYSKIVAKLEGRLSPDDCARVDAVAAKMRPLFATAVRTLAQNSEFLND